MIWRDKQIRDIYFVRHLTGILTGMIIGRMMFEIYSRERGWITREIILTFFVGFLFYGFIHLTAKVRKIDEDIRLELEKRIVALEKFQKGEL